MFLNLKQHFSWGAGPMLTFLLFALLGSLLPHRHFPPFLPVELRFKSVDRELNGAQDGACGGARGNLPRSLQIWLSGGGGKRGRECCCCLLSWFEDRNSVSGSRGSGSLPRSSLPSDGVPVSVLGDKGGLCDGGWKPFSVSLRFLRGHAGGCDSRTAVLGGLRGWRNETVKSVRRFLTCSRQDGLPLATPQGPRFQLLCFQHAEGGVQRHISDDGPPDVPVGGLRGRLRKRDRFQVLCWVVFIGSSHSGRGRAVFSPFFLPLSVSTLLRPGPFNFRTFTGRPGIAGAWLVFSVPPST